MEFGRKNLLKLDKGHVKDLDRLVLISELASLRLQSKSNKVIQHLEILEESPVSFRNTKFRIQKSPAPKSRFKKSIRVSLHLQDHYQFPEAR